METILSVSGKPGLYKLVSRGKMNLIVETIDAAHRRTPVFATDKVTSLSDIAMYTDADDVPLWQVLESVGKKEGSKKRRSTTRSAQPRSFATISPRCFQAMTATACTIATSRSCCSGTISSWKMDIPTSRLCSR